MAYGKGTEEKKRGGKKELMNAEVLNYKKQ